ncbi:serine hydrolase domain-containing protein [Kineococcus sp. LSe6-4]|uniref:Serine hydrolase domain-containing protein n=1 Tax=Kineococcus halophytocola TaxID=3234027 RepID=A0ABV4H3Z0_9ACTN
MPVNPFRSALRRSGALAAAAVAVLALTAAAAPAAPALPMPPTPSADTTGDPALAARLRAATADLAGQGFAVAAGEATAGASAAIGTAAPGRALTAATPQEIGSVTKGLTGLLLADAVERGEVEPTTTLGDVHPWLTGHLAATTLEELATHTSGLPRLSTRAALAAPITAITYGNPYRWDTPENLLRDAAWTPLRGPRGEHAYSNLGYALLGNALAQRLGRPYPQLLHERVLQPLGMDATRAAPDPLPAGRARELGPDGRPSTPWRSSGSTPAGVGVYSTAEDLGRLARAAASGELPGARALEPVLDTPGARVGWGWLSADVGGRTVVGVNGATTGVRTSVWAVPGTGQWVAVTSPSGSTGEADTQTVAFRLLGLA